MLPAIDHYLGPSLRVIMEHRMKSAVFRSAKEPFRLRVAADGDNGDVCNDFAKYIC